MLNDALESSLGHDAGLSDYPGFLQSAQYIQYMTAPTGDCFNFSDASPKAYGNIMMFWFAHKTKNPSLLWLEKKYLNDANLEFGEYLEERFLPCLLIFYGYKKSTILVSLLNAVILLVAVGIIIAESIDKLFHPVSVDGSAIAWTAGVGVVVNALTAWLFMKDKDKDLNVKGAYLHMAADALVSVGVVASGIIIMYTGWSIIDPIIGLGIAVIIIVSTWGLLHDSLRLSLDGVPVGIDTQQIQQLIVEQPGVESCHHLHIWAISTTETALTAHVVVDDIAKMEEIKHRIKEALEAAGIHHATLEIEGEEVTCSTECCED